MYSTEIYVGAIKATESNEKHKGHLAFLVALVSKQALYIICFNPPLRKLHVKWIYNFQPDNVNMTYPAVQHYEG